MASFKKQVDVILVEGSITIIEDIGGKYIPTQVKLVWTDLDGSQWHKFVEFTDIELKSLSKVANK